MNKLFHLILMMAALAMTMPAQAQEEIEAPRRHRTVIAVGPSSFWSPTLKFEQGIGDWVSLGFHGKARFVMWEGGKIEPFVRIYFTENSPQGPFIQVKGSFGAHRRNFIFEDNCYYDANGDYVCDDNYDEQYFKSFGGGVAGGYQFFFGRNEHFALDLFGGFQYIRQENQNSYNDYRYIRRIFINFPVDIGLRLGVAF